MPESRIITYAESLQVVDAESIAVEVEESILEHAAVAVAVVAAELEKKLISFKAFPAHSREDESVTVEPLGVLGVELHDPVEKNVGNGCHAPILVSADIGPESAVYAVMLMMLT